MSHAKEAIIAGIAGVSFVAGAAKDAKASGQEFAQKAQKMDDADKQKGAVLEMSDEQLKKDRASGYPADFTVESRNERQQQQLSNGVDMYPVTEAEKGMLESLWPAGSQKNLELVKVDDLAVDPNTELGKNIAAMRIARDDPRSGGETDMFVLMHRGEGGIDGAAGVVVLEKAVDIGTEVWPEGTHIWHEADEVYGHLLPGDGGEIVFVEINAEFVTALVNAKIEEEDMPKAGDVVAMRVDPVTRDIFSIALGDQAYSRTPDPQNPATPTMEATRVPDGIALASYKPAGPEAPQTAEIVNWSLTGDVTFEQLPASLKSEIEANPDQVLHIPHTGIVVDFSKAPKWMDFMVKAGYTEKFFITPISSVQDQIIPKFIPGVERAIQTDNDKSVFVLLADGTGMDLPIDPNHLPPIKVELRDLDAHGSDMTSYAGKVPADKLRGADYSRVAMTETLTRFYDPATGVITVRVYWAEDMYFNTGAISTSLFDWTAFAYSEDSFSLIAPTAEAVEGIRQYLPVTEYPQITVGDPPRPLPVGVMLNEAEINYYGLSQFIDLPGNPVASAS